LDLKRVPRERDCTAREEAKIVPPGWILVRVRVRVRVRVTEQYLQDGFRWHDAREFGLHIRAMVMVRVMVRVRVTRYDA